MARVPRTYPLVESPATFILRVGAFEWRPLGDCLVEVLGGGRCDEHLDVAIEGGVCVTEIAGIGHHDTDEFLCAGSVEVVDGEIDHGRKVRRIRTPVC